MPRKFSLCPLCGKQLQKAGRKKVCLSCNIEVYGDTFRHKDIGATQLPRK